MFYIALNSNISYDDRILNPLLVKAEIYSWGEIGRKVPVSRAKPSSSHSSPKMKSVIRITKNSVSSQRRSLLGPALLKTATRPPSESPTAISSIGGMPGWGCITQHYRDFRPKLHQWTFQPPDQSRTKRTQSWLKATLLNPLPHQRVRYCTCWRCSIESYHYIAPLT